MSSLIDRVEYRPAERVLIVDLKPQGSYRYENVPAAIAEAFTRAESPGQYFNREIRSRYPTSKIR